MEENLISVIIPVFKTEKYLRECLDSVVNQSLKQIEIICVNDGSPDNSLEILQKYAATENRIKIITTVNQGLSMARNTGIKIATGKYICFLDSDDMLAEDSLLHMYEYVSENKLNFLCFDADCIYENEFLYKNNYKNNYYQRSKAYGVGSGQQLFASFMKDNCFCDAAWILCIDRQWLKSSGIEFYPGIVHEDCLFSFQCFMRAHKVMHVNERLVIYRIREGSIMTGGKWFDSMYGRIICYIEVLKMVCAQKFAKEIQEPIADYIRFICMNAQYAEFELNESERKRYEILTPFEKMHMERMGLNAECLVSQNDEIYFNAFKCQLKKADRIYLYGAGLVGGRTLEYITHIGYVDKVQGFIITGEPNENQQIAGKKIYSIAELKSDDKDNSLLLISARSYNHGEMVRMAQKYHFGTPILIDMILEKSMESEIMGVNHENNDYCTSV